MRNTYFELYYHFVWATRNRDPFITATIEQPLHYYIRRKAECLGATIYALNGTDNHVHLACSVPPRIALSDFMRDVKGSSAHFVRTAPAVRSFIAWQEGYGVSSFSRGSLDTVIKYVANQKMHHAESTLRPKLERIDATAPEGLSFV